MAKIGLVVQSFCIIFDVAHTKYNYNRMKVMLQLEMDRIGQIGLVVQSFCIIFDVAHTKYNYNRIKVMLQLEMDRID